MLQYDIMHKAVEQSLDDRAYTYTWEFFGLLFYSCLLIIYIPHLLGQDLAPYPCLCWMVASGSQSRSLATSL